MEKSRAKANGRGRGDQLGYLRKDLDATQMMRDLPLRYFEVIEREVGSSTLIQIETRAF